MASIPNMRVAPAVPPPGASASPEAVIADIFARLIAGDPANVAVDAAAPEVVSVAPEGEAEGESNQGEAPADAQPAAPDGMLPFLEAQNGFPVIVTGSPPVAPPTVVPPAQASENVPAPAPAAIPAAKSSAPPAPIARTIVAKDESVPADVALAAVPAKAELAAAPTLDPTAAKPIVGDSKKDKPAAAGMPVVEAAPRLTAAATPIAEKDDRPTPIENHGTPVAAQSSAPLPNATAAPPPFFTPAQPVALAHAAAPAMPAAPTDLAVERELDLARDGVWLDRLARDIARSGSEDNTMRFRLHPQTLGHMRVELSQSDLGATVRITVETEAARTILVDAQPRLVAEARAQGVRLAGTEVDLAGSGPQTSGDSRRQADTDAQPMIRTARTATGEAAPAAGSAAARSDRYA